MHSSKNKRHALIIGEPGVGKSTLIARVRAELDKIEDGFETKRWDVASSSEAVPVYIRRLGEAYVTDDAHRVGYVGSGQRRSFPETFDAYAQACATEFGRAELIILDELGFLESEAKLFRKAILTLLDGEVPVLAAVKAKRTAFLDAVCEHPKACCFEIDAENRDEQLALVLAFMREQYDRKP